MENRIKECQTDLFADRTSTGTMRANQLRLWFASMAYALLCALRRIGLPHTQFAEASRHDPAQASEDRRAGPHLGAADQVRHGLGLPLAARMVARPRPITQRPPLSAAEEPCPQPKETQP